MEHICTKEKEIDKLFHTIYGNGQQGLTTIVAILEQTTKENTETMKDLRTAISGFDKFINQSIGEGKQVERYRINRQWAITIIVGLLMVTVSLAGILIKIKTA